jgi:predicted ArsR family transcriptional regulator
MKKSLLFGAGQGPRLAVLELIKRSSKGVGVKELSEAMGMSYMGVKSHCQALIAAGYLTTWREPSTKGRPLMLHLLTSAGEALFAPEQDNLSVSLLEEASGLWGESAPRKLLLKFFLTAGERYRARMKGGDPDELRKEFLRLRDAEGRMCELSVSPERMGWELRESHNPMSAVMKRYPEAAAMEESMVARVLGVPVRRREEGTRTIFSVG